MRTHLTEQDRTDYALNELQPEERLYVESMLAVSEASREDVCAMIDLAQMLEQGFESELVQAAPHEEFALTSEQRARLIAFERPSSLWHRIAGAGAAAAGLTFLFGNFGLNRVSDSASKVAEVSTQVSRIMAAAVSPDAMSLAAPLANIASFVDDSSWVPTLGGANDAADPMVCTPPTLKDGGSIPVLPDDV
jgi:anti-sigma factor RsiW